MFSLALMSASCEKDEPIVPTQTLEEQFPDWSDLTWVSTDGVSDQFTYPRLNIKIVSNVISVDQPSDGTHSLMGKYTRITISGNNFTLDDDAIPDSNDDPIVAGTFTKTGNQIIIITNGIMNPNPIYSHTYVLQIN